MPRPNPTEGINMNTNIPHQQQARQQASPPAQGRDLGPHQQGRSASEVIRRQFIASYRTTLERGETLEAQGYQFKRVYHLGLPVAGECRVVKGEVFYLVNLKIGTCDCDMYRACKSAGAVPICKHLLGAYRYSEAIAVRQGRQRLPWMQAMNRRIEGAQKWLERECSNGLQENQN
jgi:hypothetical protein